LFYPYIQFIVTAAMLVVWLEEGSSGIILKVHILRLV